MRIQLNRCSRIGLAFFCGSVAIFTGIRHVSAQRVDAVAKGEIEFPDLNFKVVDGAAFRTDENEFIVLTGAPLDWWEVAKLEEWIDYGPMFRANTLVLKREMDSAHFCMQEIRAGL